MRCSSCGRDIDAIGQDNCSHTLGYPLCEDCAGVSEDSTYLDEGFNRWCYNLKEYIDNECGE